MSDRETRPAIDLVRELRSQGRHADAAALLQATLGQAELQHPRDPELQAEVAWLELERGQLWLDQGDIARGAQAAARALALHEQVDGQVGVAAACLQLADQAWLAGERAQAVDLWARARSAADQGGAPLLAARALLALAVREWQQGEAAVAEQLLAAAEDRSSIELLADASPMLDRQALALRAATAVIRAARAVALRRHGEAQLLLGAAAQAARQAGDLSLYVECLRVDARLARHGGDPHGAVQSLLRARDAAQLAGMQVARLALQTELGLAHIDDEDWAAAAAIVEEPLPEAALAMPALRALRLDLTAALALHGGRSHEAAQLWQEAGLAHGDDHASACRSLVGLAEAQWRQGESTAALATLHRARQLAQSAGRAELAVAPQLAEIHIAAASGARTQEAAVAAVELATRAGTTIQQLASLDALAASYLAEGDPMAARAVAKQALDLAQSQPLLRWQARSAARWAQVLAAAGEAATGLRAAEQALGLAQQAGDAQGLARALLASAAALQGLGRSDEAQLSLVHAQEHARSAGLAELADDAQLQLAQALVTYGNPDGAEPLLRGLVDRSLEQRRWTTAHAAAHCLAWCARQKGDFAAAVAALARLRAAPPPATPGLALAIATERARIDLAQGRLDSARALLNHPALAQVAATPRGDAQVLAAEALARSGDWDAAAVAVERALAGLRQARAGRSLGGALYLAGQVAAARGRGEQAGALLGEALLVASQLGLPEQTMIRATIERLRHQQPDHTAA
ncbi:MAG: hypothetical protein HY902_02450 [Deltaproteobacteria bacterium]|nr:hypothetical protein [Deltaproteobacteria bacterium]